MKTILSFILATSTAYACYGQKDSTIHFIYSGEESRPHGSLVVSIHQYVVPRDKDLDFVYGLGLKTDDKTFSFIQKFLRKCTWIQSAKTDSNQYIIILPNRSHAYLQERYADTVFSTLGREIQKKKMESIVGDAFKYYYEDWKGGKSKNTHPPTIEQYLKQGQKKSVPSTH